MASKLVWCHLETCLKAQEYTSFMYILFHVDQFSDNFSFSKFLLGKERKRLEYEDTSRRNASS